MISVGITGGIGSGKTTVCKIFEVLGIPVYYADDRAKELMHGEPLMTQLKDVFGEEIYTDGQLNRKLLADRVFNDDKALKQLNGLVHPAVFEDTMKWMQSYQAHDYTLREAALLVETGNYKALHKLIVVTAPDEIRIDRVMQRDNVTRDEVLARMNKQLPQEEKEKVADYIIVNDGVQELIPQVMAIHEKLLNQA